jgi:hypothetical protein
MQYNIVRKANIFNIIRKFLMKKTIRKQVFTEDLAKYYRFLCACDMNILTSMKTMRKEVDLHQKILKILENYTESGEVSEQSLNELIAAGCPDLEVLNTFIQLEEEIENKPTNVTITSQDDASYDCSNTSCQICWRNHINKIARMLNNSPIAVKEYDEPEDL